MDKIKVIISGIFYPVAMLHYFRRAFKRREDVELWTVGPFTGAHIPWGGGMDLPIRYVISPDFALPANALHVHLPVQMIADKIPWKPDLWLQIDAGWRFSSRPPGEIIAHVQTDPHVLKAQYLIAKQYSDFVFCMQTPYILDKEIYLPYAYDPTLHYSEDREKIYDACMIGLQYQQRVDFINRLRGKGYKVFSDLGIVYDDYREKYNQSKIALSWSSLQDLPTRVFEYMGMKVPVVTNRIPDLESLFEEGEHYLGFDNLTEAVDQFETAIENYELSLEMAERAYEIVKEKHTWDHRVQQILEDVGLL